MLSAYAMPCATGFPCFLKTTLNVSLKAETIHHSFTFMSPRPLHRVEVLFGNRVNDWMKRQGEQGAME